MQGGKNWILPKEMNANRFFWDSHCLEIWSNHFCPSMGPNGVSVAMDSADHTHISDTCMYDTREACESVRQSSLLLPPQYYRKYFLD